jgi:hypothetical protein
MKRPVSARPRRAQLHRAIGDLQHAKRDRSLPSQQVLAVVALPVQQSPFATAGTPA